MSSKFTLSAAPALLAALSLTAMPAEAAEMPVSAPRTSVEVTPAWNPGEDTAANHRRYRYRRNRGVDVGDVLTGVLIIGGIAAVANAAKRDYRDRDYRDRDWRDDGEARGLDGAVGQCVDAVERDQRVQRVDSVDRDGNGWRVTGSLYNGAGFSCSIGEDGRIENIDTGGQAQPYRSGEAQPYEDGSSDDRQWGDDRYSEERARIEDQSSSDTSVPPPYDYRHGQDIDEPQYGEPGAGDSGGDIEEGTGYPGAD